MSLGRLRKYRERRIGRVPGMGSHHKGWHQVPNFNRDRRRQRRQPASTEETA